MCGKFALGSLLVVLTALLSFGAPVASAADADCEYCVNDPGERGQRRDPSANASGNGGSDDEQPSDTTATTPSAATTTTAVEPTTAPTGSDRLGRLERRRQEGGAAGGKGGNGRTARAPAPRARRPATRRRHPAVDADPASSGGDSGGGGVSIFLIVVAILALGCIGLAVWQLKRNPSDTDVDVGGKTAEVNPGA